MRKIVCAAVLAACFSSPAFAQNFGGLRVEGHGGWDHVKADVDATDGVSSVSGSGSEDGVVYGVGVGFDAPMGGQFIVGVEANFDLSSTKRCGEILGGDRGCAKVKRDYDVGGRLGLILSPMAMIYAKAAYANGKARVTYDDGAGGTFAGSKSKGGVRVGAGVEFAFATNLYGKVEYRYTNYQNVRFTDGTAALSIDVDRNQVVGGLGIRFR
jgi:outer membrane immunogenic protein